MSGEGWHFHATWRNEAWRDSECLGPKSAIPIPADDWRVLRQLDRESALAAALMATGANLNTPS